MRKIHRKTNKICSICCDEITDDMVYYFIKLDDKLIFYVIHVLKVI